MLHYKISHLRVKVLQANNEGNPFFQLRERSPPQRANIFKIYTTMNYPNLYNFKLMSKATCNNVYNPISHVYHDNITFKVDSPISYDCTSVLNERIERS